MQLNSNTHNLVCNPTLSHLDKLAKRLSCVVSTYLYGVFDSMFLSCHILVSQLIRPPFLVVLMSRNSLLKIGVKSEV